MPGNVTHLNSQTSEVCDINTHFTNMETDREVK